MKYANIQNNLVVDVCRVNPASIYPVSYAGQFIDAPDEVERGWAFDGENFLPPAPEPLPVLIATKYKFRLALLNIGLLDDIEAFIANTEDKAVKIAWQYADEYRTDDPLVLGMGYALGKSDAEIRAVFELAALL